MAAGWRVLIIEDDSNVAELYASKLRRGGYEVDVAPDGVSGFDLAGSLLPDAIILDIHLPRLSGLAALAVLRKEEATSGLPVIVLSNDDTPAVMEEAGRLGVSAYLIKGKVLPQDVAEALSDLWRGPVEMAGGLRSAAGASPQEKVLGAANHTNPVLVVDEHAATRQMVQTALELDGYQVLNAGDGVAAWNLIHEYRPAVVVAHVWMPGIDGLDVCRKIKAQETLRQVKVILYSVGITSEDEAKQAGCDQFFLMTSALSGLRDAVGRFYALADRS
ncbi:MAG: response regulator [Chloroflexi bacterium]|nr:MAG: response regulator [Chloroflexota bacterium]